MASLWKSSIRRSCSDEVRKEDKPDISFKIKSVTRRYYIALNDIINYTSGKTINPSEVNGKCRECLNYQKVRWVITDNKAHQHWENDVMVVTRGDCSEASSIVKTLMDRAVKECGGYCGFDAENHKVGKRNVEIRNKLKELARDWNKRLVNVVADGGDIWLEKI